MGPKARASMSLFRSSNYTSTYPAGQVTLPVGSPLYVGVRVDKRDPSFAVVLENCYATHSSDPSSSVRYAFIQNKYVFGVTGAAELFESYESLGRRNRSFHEKKPIRQTQGTAFLARNRPWESSQFRALSGSRGPPHCGHVGGALLERSERIRGTRSTTLLNERLWCVCGRCPTERRQVVVLESGSSLRARFSALFFLLQGDYRQVYLHCSLSLCDQRTSSCVPVSLPRFKNLHIPTASALGLTAPSIT